MNIDSELYEECAKETERHVNMLIMTNVPKSMTLSEVEIESRNDSTLTNLRKSLVGIKLTNDEKLTLDPFSRIYSELSCKGDFLIRGRQLILPSSLQNKALAIANEGHLGMSVMKALLRSKVWFPLLNQMVEKLFTL